MSGESVFRFGPFRLDHSRRRLFDGDTGIRLKPKEWDLLCCLVAHRDRVVPKEELLDRLWPRQTVTEANLSQTVYAVRKALGESARRSRWIETVPRQGYRFVSPAEQGEPAVRADGIDPAARAAYERGRYCWRRFTEPGLRQALAFFDEALETEPRFAEAHAWRSATWSALGNVGAVTPRDSAEHARRSADRAIAIDDGLATGYEMRGVVELYFDWNFEAARRSLRRAIERNPHSANAHHLLANALAFAGDFSAAHAQIQRALEIDPTALITRTDAAFFHYLAGDHETARRELVSLLEQDPVFPHARLKLAFVLAALEQPEAALQECVRAHETLERDASGPWAYLLGRVGREEAAREMLGRLVDAVNSGSGDPYGVALAYVALDEPVQALDWLAEALEFRSRDLVLLPSDPVWAPLRDRPAFAELVNAIGDR